MLGYQTKLLFKMPRGVIQVLNVYFSLPKSICKLFCDIPHLIHVSKTLIFEMPVHYPIPHKSGLLLTYTVAQSLEFVNSLINWNTFQMQYASCLDL